MTVGFSRVFVWPTLAGSMAGASKYHADPCLSSFFRTRAGGERSYFRVMPAGVIMTNAGFDASLWVPALWGNLSLRVSGL